MTLISHPPQTRTTAFAHTHRAHHGRPKNWPQSGQAPPPALSDCEPEPAASTSIPRRRDTPMIQPVTAGAQSRRPVENSRRQLIAATSTSASPFSFKKRKKRHSSPPTTGLSPPIRPLLKRRKTEPLSKALPKPTKDPLLCPFAASSAKGQKRCSGHERFESNGDIARHLQEAHGRPPYCPNCYTVFDSDADRDGHVRLRQCELSEPRQIEGLTFKQVQELSKFVDISEGSKETWARICLVVFSTDDKDDV